MNSTASQKPKMIVAEQTYRGATIQIQQNGYIAVIVSDQRKGGLVSLEEAQAYIRAGR